MNKILVGVVSLFVALVLAIGAGILSIVGLRAVTESTRQNEQSIQRIDNLTAELVRLRDENNVANCIAANVGRDAVRKAVEASLLALVPAGTTLTAEQQARVDLYNAKVEAGLPFRDCSPGGIKAFLEHQPPDPGQKGK